MALIDPASLLLDSADQPEPVRRGRGRPVGDRDARRAELIRAAISVIAQDGFAGASLRKVAQRAGCTTGAVTYYFENKEAMVSAIAESLFDDWDAFLNSAQGDIRSGIERFLNWANSEASEPWLASFQLVAHARHDPAFTAIYQRRYGQYREAVAAIIAKAQARGEVRGDIPADMLADQLCAMGDGWMIMFPIEPERFAPARMTRLLDAMVALISTSGGSAYSIVCEM